MSKNKCLNCTERKIGCHDTCKKNSFISREEVINC